MKVFVGTYSQDILFGTGETLRGKGLGIYLYRFDQDSGLLEHIHTNEGIANPSFLVISPDTDCLYAVNELKEYRGEASGSVSAYRVNKETDSLSYLNSQPTYGTDPCHVAINAAGTHILVANFSSGSMSMYPLNDDGSIGHVSAFRQHKGRSVDENRQAGPHAHAVVLSPDNRFLFVPDLGMDMVVVYAVDFERGSLAVRDDLAVRSRQGAGPRFISFHKNRRFAYVINELDSTICSYDYRADEGRLTQTGCLSTLPDDFTGESTCADLHISPSGRFLYGSNRGHDSIVCCHIDRESGALTVIGHTSTGGRCPRDFALDPRGRFLFAANQDTDSIFVFSIDEDAGNLIGEVGHVDVPTPVCIEFST